MIEAVQPYTGTIEGKWLANIRDLSNIDKHREIVVVAQAAEGAVTSGTGNLGTTHIFPRPLKHGEVVAKTTYPVPRSDPDPNLVLVPQIFFDKSGPLARHPVTWLHFYVDWLRDEFVPSFSKFFQETG